MDAAKINDLVITDTEQGYQVEALLGSNIPLADGLHVATLRYTDRFGNNGSKSVSFRVSTGSPEVVVSIGESSEVAGAYDYTLSVKNPNTLRKLYLSFAYDKDNVEVVDAEPNVPGIQARLEGWMAKGKIINNTVDLNSGRIMIEVDNLKAPPRSLRSRR